MTTDTITIAELKKNPAKHFSHPRQIVENAQLGVSDKLEVLKSWKQEIVLLMKADEENMTGDDSYELNNINQAIDLEISKLDRNL
jgi:hypothetical protein